MVCCHISFQDTIYNHFHLYSSHNLQLTKKCYKIQHELSISFKEMS